MADKPIKRINIACQGGGAHGAFTWGVLDRLLDDKRIEIEGITGTSAGAMNAVAVVQGLIKAGTKGAQDSLREFWMHVAQTAIYTPFNSRGETDQMLENWTMNNSFGFIALDYLTRMFSPYQLNPWKINPLADIIDKLFDFDAINNQSQYKVFVCATAIKTGKLKVFKNPNLCRNGLLASGCLPTLYQAVEVDGDHYWDGGFTGNPVFFPLINECESTDIVFIQLNPQSREQIPETAIAISDRLNEITNNATVMREMRAINFIGQLQEKGIINDASCKKINMHIIRDDSVFESLGWSSKLNTEGKFLDFLFKAGQNAATDWLSKNFESLGVSSSADLNHEFI